MSNKLILASSSLQRLSLLRKIGIEPFKIINPCINEEPLSKEKPLSYIKRIISEKTEASLKDIDLDYNGFILTADTIVVKGSRIIVKPKNIEDARSILNLISGSRHSVLTSFCITHIKDRLIYYNTKVVKTSVLVKNMSDAEKNWYLSFDQWKNKSGGYTIQGIFELFVKQINGSISNIMGLPTMQVYNSLVGMGYQFNYK